MFEIERLDARGVVSRHAVGARPLHVGRGPSNALVLLDTAVSTRHLVIWADEAALWAEDLRSRNGTRLNGAPLQGRARIAPGDVLDLGDGVRLRAVEQPDAPVLVPQLEDLDHAARYAFGSDRFVIGGPSAQIVVDGVAPVTLLVHRNGEVWIGRDGELEELEPDVPFSVGDRRFCLRRSPSAAMLTRTFASTRYGYALRARVGGPTGPEATLHDPRTGALHTVTADNRALLLYLLGRQFRDDVSAGQMAADAGWVRDDDVATGLWGRAQAVHHVQQLNVLVFRLRREVEAASFDPWFLEKRRKHLRVRVETAVIE